MKKLTSVQFEADGGGVFHVFRNGEKLDGYSNREYKAQQRVINLKIAEPDAEFYYKQTLKVDCVAEFEELEEFHVVAQSETGTFKTL